MSKQFNVGDKVRCIKSPGAAQVGATGTVMGKNRPSRIPFDTTGVELIDIKWDDSLLRRGQIDGGYYVDYFELIELVKDSGQYILILEKEGKLYPADSPRKYASLHQAEIVAQQMAEKNGGKFIVFKAVSTVEAPQRPKAVVVRL